MVSHVTTDPFFDGLVDEAMLASSTGLRYRLPARYFDFSMFTIEYAIPVELARTWLPSAVLQPAEVAPDTTVVSVRAFDYRRSDLAPYRELGVFVPVVHAGENLSGAYIVFLPVTTEEACVLGVELADYPKIVADIELEETPERDVCLVRVDGREVLSVTIDPRVIRPAVESREMTIITGRGSQLHVSRAVAELQIGTSTDTSGARVTLGEHPLADPFRAIDLARPAVSCWSATHGKMLLYGPHRHIPA